MARDPLKQAAGKKRYYEKNKQDYYERNNLKRQRLRAYLIQIKEANPCVDCRLFYPYYVMDFDHRPGETKTNLPNQLVNRLSWSKLEIEIRKCDLVCSNCHRFRTHARRDVKSVQKETEGYNPPPLSL